MTNKIYIPETGATITLRMRKDQQVKNILAFLTILFGESHLWHDEIMHFTPDYLIEKFTRYIESGGQESAWGIHPALRQKCFNRYLHKWDIPYDDC